MFQHFDRSAKAAVRAAADEARRRGERRVGTDHLLLGLLHGAAPAVVPLLGVELEQARAALAAMDDAALASVGIDVDRIDGRWAQELAGRGTGRQLLPFTGGTRAALQGSLRIAEADRSRVIRPRHILLALVSGGPPDQARDLLARLGVDEEVVRSRCAARTS